MLKLSVLRLVTLFAIVAAFGGASRAIAQSAGTPLVSKPTEVRIADGPVPIRILVQSPADTDTELQIICLFRSEPSNTLHGSLLEINQKLKGLLDQIRKPTLFRGDLGETLLLAPPAGSMGAKAVLIIGLGDSQTFTPERMEMIGSIAYRESSRLGVSHPFFAPTVIDGGVTGFATGQVSERIMTGILRAARTKKILMDLGASEGPVIQELTFLAGAQHAADTQQGIEKAIAEK